MLHYATGIWIVVQGLQLSPSADSGLLPMGMAMGKSCLCRSEEAAPVFSADEFQWIYSEPAHVFKA